MGGRGGGASSADMFGTPQSAGMQGPFGRGSPYSDIPSQKRDFASAMNMDMLGRGPPHGMAGIAPLGAHMLDAPGGFDGSMQVVPVSPCAPLAVASASWQLLSGIGS